MTRSTSVAGSNGGGGGASASARRRQASKFRLRLPPLLRVRRRGGCRARVVPAPASDGGGGVRAFLRRRLRGEISRRRRRRPQRRAFRRFRRFGFGVARAPSLVVEPKHQPRIFSHGDAISATQRPLGGARHHPDPLAVDPHVRARVDRRDDRLAHPARILRVRRGSSRRAVSGTRRPNRPRRPPDEGSDPNVVTPTPMSNARARRVAVHDRNESRGWRRARIARRGVRVRGSAETRASSSISRRFRSGARSPWRRRRVLARSA